MLMIPASAGETSTRSAAVNKYNVAVRMISLLLWQNDLPLLPSMSAMCAKAECLGGRALGPRPAKPDSAHSLLGDYDFKIFARHDHGAVVGLVQSRDQRAQ